VDDTLNPELCASVCLTLSTHDSPDFKPGRTTPRQIHSLVRLWKMTLLQVSHN